MTKVGCVIFTSTRYDGATFALSRLLSLLLALICSITEPWSAALVGEPANLRDLTRSLVGRRHCFSLVSLEKMKRAIIYRKLDEEETQSIL